MRRIKNNKRKPVVVKLHFSKITYNIWLNRKVRTIAFNLVSFNRPDVLIQNTIIVFFKVHHFTAATHIKNFACSDFYSRFSVHLLNPLPFFSAPSTQPPTFLSQCHHLPRMNFSLTTPMWVRRPLALFPSCQLPSSACQW